MNGNCWLYLSWVLVLAQGIITGSYIEQRISAWKLKNRGICSGCGNCCCPNPFPVTEVETKDGINKNAPC